VKQYYQAANEIQARQNGLVDETPQSSVAQPPVSDSLAVPDSLHLPPLNLPQK
jgi:hypothetical protein